MGIDHLEIPPDKLHNICSPEDLGFETTEEVAPLEGTIGQERAMSALGLAFDIDVPGFNLFIAGIPGTGRNTALRANLERIAITKPVPSDWGYVYNFQDPSQPVAISLPCGMFRQLARDMDELVESCRRDILKAFESDEYVHRVQDVTKSIQAKHQAVTSALEKEASELGFALTPAPGGIQPVPVTDGRPMSPDEYNQLSEAAREKLKEKSDRLQHSITHGMSELRRLSKEATEQTREVDRELLRFTLTPIVDELKERYSEHPAVADYLAKVEADMADNLEIFKPQEETGNSTSPIAGAHRDEDVFAKYKVNDLIDSSKCEGAPVVFEYSPTYYNLFGRIDYKARVGTFTTDLTMIKEGAFHRANGGYLVLQARDLLISPLSWDTLKRSLRSGQVRIENIGDQYSPLPSSTLRPQPIPINTKVIIIGSPDILRLLQSADDDFRRYFKVVADFDTVMDRTTENMSKYAAFVSARCRDSGLRPFHKTAVGRIIDYSSRLVEHHEKLMTRFMDVADMITEADHWAGTEDSALVMGDHVVKAIEQRRYRASLFEDRLKELVEKGIIHIDTDSETVGQVNGLSVYSLGDFIFGKPSRITARVSLGQGRVMNIERETRLSGRIHDKGFAILTGYLQGKYGQDKPLSLSASIGFEQTYSEVDGDSASSTELYALLSGLSGLPIKQGVAVTGSVNQTGEVQAIGGATHKVEGFFDLCKARGLTGDQGVMVPKDNLNNLVLKDEVVEAVKAREFHIYGVSTIDQGIEVLTGTPAGERRKNGTYPRGTVHHRVERRLRELAKKAREFGRARNKKEEDSSQEEEDQ